MKIQKLKKDYNMKDKLLPTRIIECVDCYNLIKYDRGYYCCKTHRVIKDIHKINKNCPLKDFPENA